MGIRISDSTVAASWPNKPGAKIIDTNANGEIDRDDLVEWRGPGNATAREVLGPERAQRLALDTAIVEAAHAVARAKFGFAVANNDGKPGMHNVMVRRNHKAHLG